MKQLDAGEYPLGKVFSSDFEFAIPDYQRPYSWGTEQALQLLDDLSGAIDRDADEPYFLGSLVLVRDNGRRAEVIDGQQRLTTLMLIAHARLIGQQLVQSQHRIVTVEHVLPQQPKKGSQWLADFDEQDRDYWTHRLANLVLLNKRKNSSAQRFDFDKKKQQYFSGSNGVATFALTLQVLKKDSWTPEILKARQRSLVKRLSDEWELK